jgi:predicted DNA-binding transcriptional regulator AlpA
MPSNTQPCSADLILVQGTGASRLALPAKDAADLVGVSRAQWWKLHASGKIPLPVYLGTKAPRWRVEELRAWLAAGCPDRLAWQKLRRPRHDL